MRRIREDTGISKIFRDCDKRNDDYRNLLREGTSGAWFSHPFTAYTSTPSLSIGSK